MYHRNYCKLYSKASSRSFQEDVNPCQPHSYDYIKWYYYINTSEILGELLRENVISSWAKITGHLHTWKDDRCYGKKKSHRSTSGLQKILKTINFSSSPRSLVEYFSTLEETFRISARPCSCDILYISSNNKLCALFQLRLPQTRKHCFSKSFLGAQTREHLLRKQQMFPWAANGETFASGRMFS